MIYKNLTKVWGKGLFFLIIVVTAGLVFTSQTQALESNSYYQYRMNVGETISTIVNNLHLDYQEQLTDYKIRTTLDLDKEYRFLEGYNHPQDWRYDNYLVSISRGNNRWALGLVSPEASSNFLYTSRELLGTYVKWKEYKLWSGYGRGSLGLASRNDLQLGFSYQNDGASITYQTRKENNKIYNHYLEYQNNYSFSESGLRMSVVAGSNSAADIWGVANRVQFSSMVEKVNYTTSIEYKSPGFEAVKSRLDEGYGSCRVNLSARRRLLDALFVSSNLGYDRNNLTEEAESVNHDWFNNWNFDYYAGSGVTYFLDLSYDLKETYNIEEDYREFRQDNIKTKLGYKTRSLNLSLNHNYNLNKRIEEGDTSNRIITARLKYDPSSYQLNGQYSWVKDEDWYRELELDFNYSRELTDDIDYNLGAGYRRSRSSVINLNQGVKYDLSPRQLVNANLNLRHYIGSSNVRKSFYLRYRYKF